MLFIEDGQVWESFVYVPKKPIALDTNNKWDVAMVNELVVKAKAGDNEAQKLLFEQLYFKWKPYLKKCENTVCSQEDVQQDMFLLMMETLARTQASDASVFVSYYVRALKTYREKAIREQNKQNLKTVSLDERDINGNLKYDLPDTIHKELNELGGLNRVRKLLTDHEFEVCILTYLWGYSEHEIAKFYGFTYKYVRNLIYRVRTKLKVLL